MSDLPPLRCDNFASSVDSITSNVTKNSIGRGLSQHCNVGYNHTHSWVLGFISIQGHTYIGLGTQTFYLLSMGKSPKGYGRCPSPLPWLQFCSHLNVVTLSIGIIYTHKQYVERKSYFPLFPPQFTQNILQTYGPLSLSFMLTLHQSTIIFHRNNKTITKICFTPLCQKVFLESFTK